MSASTTGYVTEDGYYFAPGAIVAVMDQRKCKCPCHDRAISLMHFGPCCAHVPEGTPTVPAIGNPISGAVKILYGEGSYEDRLKAEPNPTPDVVA